MMRYTVCLVLLVPVLALAAGPARLAIGAADTVGGTTYDWQLGGPSWRMLVSSAGRGIYVAWMYSASTSGSYFPDRNMRTNYYDRLSHEWAYIDSTDFMSSGTGVFPRRSGYGGIDTDTSGVPFVSCHATLGGAVMPWVAKAKPESYSDSTDLPICMWPAIAAGQNGSVHILAMTISYDMVYSRIAPDSWPHWSSPINLIAPYPGFPNHNISASKVSDKVSLVWVVSESSQAYQMHSSDGGLTWDSASKLTAPDAFGGDTVTGFHMASLFPFYDRHDRLHIMASLLPVLGDTVLIVPSQIWHYCPVNTPQWSRVQVAGCDPANMKGTVGLNAAYACRPSIGEDRAGGLYVTWEQFDSLNVDTSTSRLRADIFLARDEGDNGATWEHKTRISDRGPWSCRFPSAIDYFEDDSFRVSYMIDQQAGFFAGVPTEGAATRNPVVVHKVPVTVGIAEGRELPVTSSDLTVAPNPFGRATTISYQIGRAGPVALTIHDVAGKAVQRLASGPQPAGLHSVSWDGRDARGCSLPTGVYFCTIESGRYRTSRKIIRSE